MDAEVIITSLYNTVDPKDPKRDAKRRLAAMIATFAEKRLVGCIIAKGATEDRSEATKPSKSKKKANSYAKSSTRPFFCCPVPKNEDLWVLGFYIITDYWKAQVDGGEVTMFRLERWKLEDKAWFASQAATHDPPPLSARDFTTKATQEKCNTCATASPRMYEEYFLCRNEQCADYWKHDGEVSREVLTYTKKYLQQREPRPQIGGYKPYGAYQGNAIFPEIAPHALPWWQTIYQALENQQLTKETYEVRMNNLSRGFWCPNCGMLNTRRHWEKWECANTRCNFSMQGYPKISTVDVLTGIYKTPLPEWTQLPCYAGEEDADGYTKYNFDLEAGCGVAILVPHDATNRRLQGADYLLDRLQTLASTGRVDLQKQFALAGAPGVLTSHFIHNYGRDYQLTVDIRQKSSFEDAPDAIRIAKNAANDLCRQYQMNPTSHKEDFNQCYLAAYFTKNHMGWHADGERGLGSVIATWTLGGEGEMEIAPNDEQYWGQVVGRGKVIEDDALLPGILKREERIELKFDLDQKLAAIQGEGKAQDAERKKAFEEYNEEFKELMKDDIKGNSETPKTLLKLPLTHGSIVVMHGENFQNYFRHQVHVQGPLRFALTFRCITDEHYKGKVSKRVLGVYPYNQDQTYLDNFDDLKEYCEEQGDAQLANEKDRMGSNDGQQKGEGSTKTGDKRKKDKDSDGEQGETKQPKRTKKPKGGCADPKDKGKQREESDDEDMDKPEKPARRGLRSGSSQPASNITTSTEQKARGTGRKIYRNPKNDPMEID